MKIKIKDYFCGFKKLYNYIMKKLTFILLAVAGSLAFVNCSSDDDKGGEDCSSCGFMGIETKICYTEGNSYYTMTVTGGTSQNVEFAEGETWAEVKSSFDAACDLGGL